MVRSTFWAICSFPFFKAQHIAQSDSCESIDEVPPEFSGIGGADEHECPSY